MSCSSFALCVCVVPCVQYKADGTVSFAYYTIAFLLTDAHRPTQALEFLKKAQAGSGYDQYEVSRRRGLAVPSASAHVPLAVLRAPVLTLSLCLCSRPLLLTAHANSHACAASETQTNYSGSNGGTTTAGGSRKEVRQTVALSKAR